MINEIADNVLSSNCVLQPRIAFTHFHLEPVLGPLKRDA